MADVLTPTLTPAPWPAPRAAPVNVGFGVPVYSSGEVVRQTGVSYRQLDYWTRMGYIPGQAAGSVRGSGHHRIWSVGDVHRVRLLQIASRLQHGSLAAVVDWLDEIGMLEPIERQLHELERGA